MIRRTGNERKTVTIWITQAPRYVSLFTVLLGASARILSHERDPNAIQRMARNSLLWLIFVATIFPTGPASGLEGTASWDIELVREYIKNSQGVEMPAEPATFPAQGKLAELNPAFAVRMKALLAIYQTHGGAPQIGIMPDGGLRSRAIEILRQDNIRKQAQQKQAQQNSTSVVPRYPGYDGFRQVRDTSVYDVEVYLHGEEIDRTLLRSRFVDTDGYTTDGRIGISNALFKRVAYALIIRSGRRG